ncbi:hypothetical protein ANCCEY_06592 [Ancylostoma ceylanicum]|uniref:Kinesin motor domain-containing protein n=1 Tax=Ancylostoma ceylanicum TaxID=53326 RepID=A0A0D6LR38_9BILA|nr:hypothetical protein ANCCEY_06592 [Ancylostoma ceylanicum]
MVSAFLYRVGRLNLVDLAGSERQAKTGATGERFKSKVLIPSAQPTLVFDSPARPPVAWCGREDLCRLAACFPFSLWFRLPLAELPVLVPVVAGVPPGQQQCDDVPE